MNRAEVAQIFSRLESFRWNAIQGIHWGKRENSKEGVMRGNSAVTWSVTACKLGELTAKFRIDTESEDWYLTIAAPSSSKGDQSKLGGPEESMFERSPGVGREERPPIAVVVQAPEQVLPSNSLCLITVYDWILCF